MNIADNLNVTGNIRVDENFQFDAAGQAVNNIRTDVRSVGADNLSLVTEAAVRTAITDGVTADNGLTENPEGNIQLGGTLIQNTTITNDGFDLVIDGNTGDVTFDSEGLVTAGNGIDVTAGDVDITENLNVTGNLNADGIINLASTGVLTTVEGTLQVDETANFDGNVDANAGLDVTGLLQANDNVILGFDNTDALTVNATADFNDVVNIDGNLDANNGIDITSGDLTVADNATITGNTRVDGNFQFDLAGQTVDNIVTTIGTPGLDTNLPTEKAVRDAITTSSASKDELAELNDVDITNYSAGSILIADGADSYDQKTMSGDATIAADGTLTIEDNAITSAKINDGEIANADISATAAIVDTKLATISTAGKVSNSATTATSANTANAIVTRDVNGDFSANEITADLIGNASTATTATNFSGNLAGDVTGPQGTTVVATVGGSSAANIATAEALANAATNLNTASAIVKRDASGNFSAGTITANLNGNATNVTGVVAIANGGTNSSTALNNDRLMISSGDAIVEAGALTNGQLVVGSTGLAPQIVTMSGDATIDNAGALTLANTAVTAGSYGGATEVATFTVDSKGRLTAAGTTTITGTSPVGSSLTDANIWIGDGSNQAAAVPVSGDIAIDNTGLTAISSGVIVNDDISATAAIVDTKLATISTAGKVSNSATTATDANTANAIVARDASGNFSAGTINATTQTFGDNSTKVATTEFVTSAIPTYSIVVAPEKTTPSTVLVDIPGLSASLQDNAIYEFEAVISVASDDPSGNRYGVNFTGAGARVESQISGTRSTTTARAESIYNFNTASSAFVTFDGDGAIKIQGLVITSTNSGTFTIQHLSVAGTTATAYSDSYLKVRRVQ